MTAFSVRPAQLTDAPQINAHRHRVSDEPGNGTSWSPGEYTRTDDEHRALMERTLAQNNAMMAVAEADGQIIGLMVAQGGTKLGNRHVAVIGIDVNRDWRGQGVGRALMDDMLNWARQHPVIQRVELEVFIDNTPALHLYEKLGFVVEGRRKDVAFKEGVYRDLLMMSLMVKEPPPYTPTALDARYPRDIYAKATQMEASRANFISYISHDLRNPLATIRGFTELALGMMDGTLEMDRFKEDAPQLDTFIRPIYESAARAADGIDKLLDMGRLDALNWPPSEACAVAATLEELIEIVKPVLKTKNIQLTTSLPADLPPVWAVCHHLARVLSLVLDNAIRYTPADGRISITAEVQDAAQMVVKIQDSGIGIQPENLQQVFQPFWRAQEGLVQEQSGFGLGLSIARGFIQRVGGKLWLESVYDSGTTVFIQIPLAREA